MGIRSSRCQRPSILKSPARSCNRTFISDSGNHPKCVWPVTPDEFFPVPWIGARQTAQREQPCYEAQVGVCLARTNQLVDLVETGEVVPRLGRGGRQGSTAGQFNDAGYGADGHEPTDWSNWFTHRSFT